MRLVRMSAILVVAIAMWSILCETTTTGKTIYSVPFCYKRAKPSFEYFSEKSRAEIDRLCKTGEHASTDDIAACSQRDFERVAMQLSTIIKSQEAEYRKNDLELTASNDPVALPKFEKAQSSWTEYRDNQCYAETYSLGEASMRYMTFWDCMTRITKERISDLKSVED